MKYILMILTAMALVSTANASSRLVDSCCGCGGACCVVKSSCC